MDIRPQGSKGKRIRKHFDTKNEAQRYEKHTLATQHNKDWLEKPTDRRPLSELIELWWKLHGQTLKSGGRNYQALQRLDRDLNHPRADQINRTLFADYRVMRMAVGNKPATINRTQKLLSGVFTTLIASGHYHNTHPLERMAQIKLQATEMAFLTKGDISALLACLDGDTLRVVKLCLATGARWSEAATLNRENLMKYKVTFMNTKNGKNRTVPISVKLYDELAQQQDRILFPTANYKQVRETLKRLVSSLPDGQAVHVLRHTFASHFMMRGGNILTLQKILGHSTISQTMTYAHFSPDYLQDAVKFNPLADYDQ